MLGTEKGFPTGNSAAVRSCNGETWFNLFVDVLQSSGMNCKNKFLVLKERWGLQRPSPLWLPHVLKGSQKEGGWGCPGVPDKSRP